MPSNDRIMIQKFYEGTPQIVNLSIEIGKLLGIVDSTYLRKPQTRLRKENKIKIIQSSLEIEGNTLSVDQVSALFDNKRVMGPPKDILEVQNAIQVYQDLDRYDAFKEESYLEAHRTLMNGLIPDAGRYRTGNVGIFKGEQVAHMAPPAWNVPNLMGNLFQYLRENADNLVIKSCVFHYEMEFIHPFMDGNGRMGRLWQTVILMQENPIFEFLPIEAEIRNLQQAYYDVLATSDKEGIATRFVEFMLEIILKSLGEQVQTQRVNLSDLERIQYFREQSKLSTFTRKDYMEMFKDISSATATRDLRLGVEQGILKRRGENRNTVYEFAVG
jgi:Fic family protein